MITKIADERTNRNKTFNQLHVGAHFLNSCGDLMVKASVNGVSCAVDIKNGVGYFYSNEEVTEIDLEVKIVNKAK